MTFNWIIKHRSRTMFELLENLPSSQKHVCRESICTSGGRECRSGASAIRQVSRTTWDNWYNHTRLKGQENGWTCGSRAAPPSSNACHTRCRSVWKSRRCTVDFWWLYGCRCGSDKIADLRELYRIGDSDTSRGGYLRNRPRLTPPTAAASLGRNAPMPTVLDSWRAARMAWVANRKPDSREPICCIREIRACDQPGRKCGEIPWCIGSNISSRWVSVSSSCCSSLDVCLPDGSAVLRDPGIPSDRNHNWDWSSDGRPSCVDLNCPTRQKTDCIRSRTSDYSKSQHARFRCAWPAEPRSRNCLVDSTDSSDDCQIPASVPRAFVFCFFWRWTKNPRTQHLLCRNNSRSLVLYPCSRPFLHDRSLLENASGCACTAGMMTGTLTSTSGTPDIGIRRWNPTAAGQFGPDGSVCDRSVQISCWSWDCTRGIGAIGCTSSCGPWDDRFCEILKNQQILY